MKNSITFLLMMSTVSLNTIAHAEPIFTSGSITDESTGAQIRLYCLQGNCETLAATYIRKNEIEGRLFGSIVQFNSKSFSDLVDIGFSTTYGPYKELKEGFNIYGDSYWFILAEVDAVAETITLPYALINRAVKKPIYEQLKKLPHEKMTVSHHRFKRLFRALGRVLGENRDLLNN